jgi:TPR repeat protein
MGAWTAQDRPAEAAFLKLTADQGCADAQFNCAILLLNGDGIAQNKSLAAHYFKLSADQGNADAQRRYDLLLLENGETARA